MNNTSSLDLVFTSIERIVVSPTTATFYSKQLILGAGESRVFSVILKCLPNTGQQTYRQITQLDRLEGRE